MNPKTRKMCNDADRVIEQLKRLLRISVCIGVVALLVVLGLVLYHS